MLQINILKPITMAKSKGETKPIKIVTQIPKPEVRGSVPKMVNPPAPPAKKGKN